MTFAHTLGEFGVILMVGGNISSSTRPASIAIYEKVEGLELAPAHLYSAVLLVLSFILLLTMNWVNQRTENNNDLL